MTDQSTNMTPEWIANVLKNYPCQEILDEHGRPTGNYRTCPGRMSFPNIFKRSKPIPPNTEGKFGLNFIFPEGANLSVLKKACAAVAKERWTTAGTAQSPKLRTPFKDGDEMGKYDGYVGRTFITATGDRQPPFVDQRLAPIVDEAKAYPGAWVMLSIRPFAYDKGVNKGVSFGLQSVMFICDDKDLGGTSANPNRDFAGVSITNDVNPAAAFGAAGPEDDEDVDVFA
jgi:hypothetical protein